MLKKPNRMMTKLPVLKKTKDHKKYMPFDLIWDRHCVEMSLLYDSLYQGHPHHLEAWRKLQEVVFKAFSSRSKSLKTKDQQKAKLQGWHLSNELAGMSLYADRFNKDIKGLEEKLDYLQELGVNVIHLMPVFQSPPHESDGGYAVSDFRKVDNRFGNLPDLKHLIQDLNARGMYLMLDIVLNHTSHQHAWAVKAKKGDRRYAEYYYMYEDRTIPDLMEQTMPEIFPQSSPGSFSYVSACDRWVMTVFHSYQWDLNYTNPRVLADMLDHVLYYAGLGVDILRIDAPAFIWKETGTDCQNLPQAHDILRLIKHCVQIAAPGMTLLGEAIVAPQEIMKYFGEDDYNGRECDFAYNATLMALQWDALATGRTGILSSAQPSLSCKPPGTSWITYTRCHDDIGLGFSDEDIRQAGFDPYLHRKFLKEYYSGIYPGSPAKGALFSVNPRTHDARISGTLASLCGLEQAVSEQSDYAIHKAVNRILMMQALSFFIGGLPMLFYGDEVGYTNDYTCLQDPTKSYDNRWMHRPLIDWDKNDRVHQVGTVESNLYQGIRHLLSIRRLFTAFSDHNTITWLPPENIHVAGFLRFHQDQKIFCLFNFSAHPVYLSWYIFKGYAGEGAVLFDHWGGEVLVVGPDQNHFMISGYGMVLAELRSDH